MLVFKELLGGCDEFGPPQLILLKGGQNVIGLPDQGLNRQPQRVGGVIAVGIEGSGEGQHRLGFAVAHFHRLAPAIDGVVTPVFFK